jgi:SMC interacting uncharacterized protein involved in chromosome segregation
MDKNAPVTKNDLAELESRIDAKFRDTDAHLKDVDTHLKDVDTHLKDVGAHLKDMEARLVEKIRDSQTELLRGFEKFQTANNIRMRKLEANVSNLDTSATMRLENLEERVLEIEKKLIRGNGKPNGPKN